MIHRPLEDWEYPDPDDENYDEGEYGEGDGDEEYGSELESDTRPCPACGTEVYEDAEQCPACGQYVTFRNPALAGLPWWFVAIGIIGIIAVIVTMAGF